MQLTRRRVLAASGVTFGLAGCTSDDGDTDDNGSDSEDGTDGTDGEDGTDGTAENGTDGTSDDGTDGTTQTEPAVTVDSHPDHGDILVDFEGMTLYMFDADTRGEAASACNNECADAWPPLTVEEDAVAGENVDAELTTFEREDGSTQVAADGWPLYYFANDGEPGDANGQGVNDAWWVLRPDGTPVRPAEPAAPTVQVRSHAEHGDILVDSEGMTLYMFDADTRGEGASACQNDCADAWPPLTVEDGAVAGDGVDAELTTFEREDGSMQVTANGWPLYYFAQDEQPGDTSGQGVQDAWWVLRPDGTPVRPDQPTVQVRSHTDHGDILVDSEGMTLYMFDADTRGEAASACHDDCADAWPPLTVEDEAIAGEGVDAELSTFEREDGSMQVTANGYPLYYFAQDEQPGDTSGQGVQDAWWVLRPDGTPVRPDQPTVQVRSHAEHGDILVDSEGMTLYMFESDTQGAGESSCSGMCADNWPPLTVDGEPVAGAAVGVELTTFERPDGSMQVAANGWPLYFYASDEQPGDAAGQGVGDAWYVLDPAGQPVKPDDGSDGYY